MEIAEIVGVAALCATVALFAGGMIDSLGQSDGRADWHDKREELREQVEALQDQLTHEAKHARWAEEASDAAEGALSKAKLEVETQKLAVEAHRRSNELLMRENRRLWEAMKPKQVASDMVNQGPVFMEPDEGASK